MVVVFLHCNAAGPVGGSGSFRPFSMFVEVEVSSGHHLFPPDNSLDSRFLVFTSGRSPPLDELPLRELVSEEVRSVFG